MIVQCPNCSARYRVNEQNIPATGGRISCPSCQHAFVVYPESSAAPAAPSASAAYDGEKTSVATDINSLMAGLKMNQGSDAGESDDFAATEVIGGDALANFNFNDPSAFTPPDDGTVEMKNPLSFIKSYESQQPEPPSQQPAPPKQRVTPFRDTVVAGDRSMPFDEMTMAEGDLRTEVAQGISFDPPEPLQPPRQPPAMPSPGAPRFPTGQNPSLKNFQGALNNPAAAQPQAQPVAPPARPAPPMTPPASPFTPSPSGQQPSPFASQGPASQAAAPAVPEPAAGPSATHQGPWKLKTDFGLTYEFQDSKSLLNWMSGRESLNNYELSAGDDRFFAWRDFPQIAQGMTQGKAASNSAPLPHPTGALPAASATPSGSSPAVNAPNLMGGARPPQPATGFEPAFPSTAPSPSGAFPSAGGPPLAGTPSQAGRPIAANQSAYVPPSRDAKWNVVLWILFVVLALGCLALAAQIFGFVNFKEMLGLEKPAPIEAPVTRPVVTPPVTTPSEETPDSVQDPDEAPAVSPEDQKKARTMVEDARREMEANKLASARQKLETALVLDPDLREIYLLLAEVYEESGLPDKAKEMKDKLQLLQNQEIEMKDDTPIMP